MADRTTILSLAAAASVTASGASALTVGPPAAGLCTTESLGRLVICQSIGGAREAGERRETAPWSSAAPRGERPGRGGGRPDTPGRGNPKGPPDGGDVPSAIPLPATGWLILAGLGWLGLLRRGRLAAT